MKSLRCLLHLALAVSTQGCFAQSYNMPAKFSVLVKDERTGLPMEGAQVRASFEQNLQTTDRVRREEITSTNGTVTLAASTSGHINWAVRKEGYYTTINQPLELRSTPARWEPWNATNEVVLRPILKPVVMQIIPMSDLRLPKVGQKVGYDLLTGDWVAPHGRGVHTDLEFEAQGFFKSHNDHDSTVTMRLPNKGDGVVVVGTNEFSRSELLLPRYAPETGYSNAVSWHFKGVLGADGFRQDTEPGFVDGFVFRFRTVLDEKGNVRSARYAKMLMVQPIRFGGMADGSFLQLGKLHLNPTLNDRNLEESREQFINAEGNLSGY